MRRILYVEDYPAQRDILARLLESEGFEVTTAKDGIEGVEKTRAWHPDIVLMDLRMPRMDGFEAIKAIRSNSQTADILIYAISAWASKKHKERAKEAGANGHFTKPVDLNKLVAVLKGEQMEEVKEEEDSMFSVAVQKLSRILRRLFSQKNAKSTIDLIELSRLIDGIVHDMRNGLGVIRHTIGFLEDDLANSEYQADLLKISYSLNFCEIVLRNLTTLGEQDFLQPTRIDLETIVREMHFILERKLVDVKFALDMAPDATVILADAGQMKQVFMNLIKNAGEAMPDGGTLTVRSRRVDDMLHLEISDTGCGISPGNQARLFQEFFTTKDRGYGLGLHIVNSIVKRLGGTIEVQSKLNEGTTFILHLPLEEA